MSSIAANDTYPSSSSAFQGGYEGATFQLKLLKLFALRAFNKKLDFKVWTEDEAAGKFDDLLFSYTINNQIRLTFGQAKHKVIGTKFKFKNFFQENYNLYKYFNSLIEIERNFNVNYINID